jgi:hypothetical protein
MKDISKTVLSMKQWAIYNGYFGSGRAEMKYTLCAISG